MSNVVTINGKSFTLPTDNNNYWKDRMFHDLYRLTVSIAQGMFPEAKSAIDVGSYTSGMLCELDWIQTRVATDIQKQLEKNWSTVDDVKFIAGNAFELEFESKFDLVLSNQTIEHLEDPAGFVDKLLGIGKGLIISTTYNVAAGFIDGHIQDPISMEKFKSWFPCELDAWAICHHPSARQLKHIVAVVKQSHPNN